MGLSKQQAVTRSVMKTCFNRACAEIDQQARSRAEKITRLHRYISRMDKGDLQALLSVRPEIEHSSIKSMHERWRKLVSQYDEERSRRDAQTNQIQRSADDAKRACKVFFDNIFAEINLVMSVEELQKLRQFQSASNWIATLSKLGFDAMKIVATFPEWLVVQIPLRRHTNGKTKTA